MSDLAATEILTEEELVAALRREACVNSRTPVTCG